jgi:hypothetical protein
VTQCAARVHSVCYAPMPHGLHEVHGTKLLHLKFASIVKPSWHETVVDRGVADRGSRRFSLIFA